MAMNSQIDLGHDKDADVAGTATLDIDSLEKWMDAQGLPGSGLAIEHSLVSGGSQNEIFRIRRGTFSAALRKPPLTALAGRDEGIIREWRIIEALRGTDVPHAEAIALCADKSILGRTFYLMELVDGWSPMSVDGWPAPFDNDVVARRGLAFELIDGVARLSMVDWEARGLNDLGRPEGFHDRQVERWTRFLERCKNRELPGLEEATSWLASHRPIDYLPGLMHGDYQLANVLFGHRAPARLTAIVDWEMGTIGDPKLDLAWALQSWPEDTSEPNEMSYVDLTDMPGRSELLRKYSELSGRQVDDMDYYFVLARWKLAIVLEQGYQRAGDDEKLRSFGQKVLDLFRSAADLAMSSDYRGPTI